MRLTVACSVLLLVGCTGTGIRDEPNPLLAPPVEAKISVETIKSWPVRERLDVDLDGDGRSERLVLAADATRSTSGAVLWEDGHRWAAFVEEGDGNPTLLYSAFVPNGHVEVAATIVSSENRRDVFVLERTPGQVRTLVVAYDGPRRARSVSSGYYHLDGWIRDLRNLP